MMIVYLIRHRDSGACYVGQTTHSLASRMRGHQQASTQKKKRRQSAIARAIHKHGWAAFDVEELERCGSQGALDAAEVRWIEVLGTLWPSGFNIREGGSGGRLSSETRAKLSACKRGRKQSPEVIDKRIAPLRGRKRPRAVREAISSTLKGRSITWGDKIGATRRQLCLTLPDDRKKAFVRSGQNALTKLRDQGTLSIDGERNPNAKLTQEDVSKIRATWAGGGVSQKSIADRYDVKQVAISRIVRNITWRD